eukprot:12470250-Alexandrium_andersonii.AAC.1
MPTNTGVSWLELWIMFTRMHGAERLSSHHVFKTATVKAELDAFKVLVRRVLRVYFHPEDAACFKASGKASARLACCGFHNIMACVSFRPNWSADQWG